MQVSDDTGKLKLGNAVERLDDAVFVAGIQFRADASLLGVGDDAWYSGGIGVYPADAATRNRARC